MDVSSQFLDRRQNCNGFFCVPKQQQYTVVLHWICREKIFRVIEKFVAYQLNLCGCVKIPWNVFQR